MRGGRLLNVAAASIAVVSGGWPGAWSVGSEARVPADAPREIVVVGVPPERSARIVAEATEARRAIETVVFGAPSRLTWAPACIIHVHGDRRAFVRAVGGGSMAAAGATSIEFTGDSVSLRRIDVVDGRDGGLPPALVHELVHVVLADHFTAGPPPRWADEGLATLFDEPAKQRGHEADFRSAMERGMAWDLADLMALDLDPADVARQRVFYGQSASLVRWLLARGDGPMFLRFLDDASSEGVNDALRKHYGFESTVALERAWRADPTVTGEASAVGLGSPPGPARPGPGI